MALIILFPLLGHVASAANITIFAEDTKGQPVRAVRFNFLNTGALSPPSTAEGRVVVYLKGDFKPGQNVELRVSSDKNKRPDWVFISPWDSRIVVPDYGEVVKVVLARRSDKASLTSDEGMRAVAQNYARKTEQQQLTEKQRQHALSDVADSYGLTVEEIGSALKAWKNRTRDPHDIELIHSVEKQILGIGGYGGIGNLTIITNAPQGIAISGGVVTNPTVNNYPVSNLINSLEADIRVKFSGKWVDSPATAIPSIIHSQYSMLEIGSAYDSSLPILNLLSSVPLPFRMQDIEKNRVIYTSHVTLPVGSYPLGKQIDTIYPYNEAVLHIPVFFLFNKKDRPENVTIEETVIKFYINNQSITTSFKGSIEVVLSEYGWATIKCGPIDLKSSGGIK